MTISFRRALAALVLAGILGGCGVTPSPSPSPSAAPAIGAEPVTTPEAAAADAIQQASIRGPFNVGEVRQGTYADLWAGSTSNALDGPGKVEPDPDLVVWRVDLVGPTGREQLYLDAATGDAVGSIVQGQ
jgi:hypothetical protein